MNLRDLMINDLSFSTQRGITPFLLNLGKGSLYLPIIGTIMGIVLITIGAIGEKRGDFNLIFGEGKHRIPRIVIISLCTAALGLIFLGLAIAGTVLKVKERAGILQPPQTSRNIPGIATKKIRPPDYLL